MNSFKKATIS